MARGQESSVESHTACLLAAAGAGDRTAAAELLSLLYRELRQLAVRQLVRERSDHTLQPTALVHEAFLRLVGSDLPVLHGREQLFAVAAEAMRRVLVEHARARGRRKRGGGRQRIELANVELTTRDKAPEILEIHEALLRLESIDPELATLVKLRCFAGLTIAETACAMGCSSRTITRDWLVAKAWLKAELAEGTPGSSPAQRSPARASAEQSPRPGRTRARPEHHSNND
jgi:RNA polymerase sigma factor (TIGR02999 family)